jgi:RNA polymerase subunit RPABC4/transcription elongation factor Spt4
VDDAMRSHMSRGVAEAEIRNLAVQGGMRPMCEDGLDKARRGVTTLEEVSRVVYLPEQGVKLCGSCNTVVSQEFEYCPTCGHFVGEHCAQCHRRMEGPWAFCPKCGTAAKRSAAERPVQQLVSGRRAVARESPSGSLRRAS